MTLKAWVGVIVTSPQANCLPLMGWMAVMRSKTSPSSLGVTSMWELACFRHPHVPPTNNQAERSLRPVVIMRKVIHGTRSPNSDWKVLFCVNPHRNGKDLIFLLHAELVKTLRHYQGGGILLPVEPFASESHVERLDRF